MTTQTKQRQHLNPNTRGGTTLLEVLVASGILVVGLASVAALLPAAASVMAEASRLDRAANLGTNAVADLRFRGLLTAASFTGQVKTLVFGEMFPNTPFGSNPFRRQAVPPTPLDEQAYGTAWYGATVSPLAADGEVKKGMPARVTVAVFKQRDPEAKLISLTRRWPGVYQITVPEAPEAGGGGSSPEPEDAAARQREADRKRFLPACAWVAVRVNDRIRWLHVGNSWTTYATQGQRLEDKQIDNCFVSFSDPAAADEAAQGAILMVHAFSGLIKLEEHIAYLD